MSKALWLSAVSGLAVLVSAAACSAQCAIYCFHMQPVLFVDANGAPLAPLSVTAGGQVFSCDSAEADAGVPPVICTGNQVSFDLRSFDTQAIHAEARTGEVFTGDITPIRVPGSQPAGSCGCGNDTWAPITLTLTAP